MSLTREQYVQICRRCTNRDFNKSEGIICGLTDSPPNFKNECPSFKLDEDENEYLLKQGLEQKLSSGEDRLSITPIYKTNQQPQIMPTSIEEEIEVQPNTFKKIIIWAFAGDLFIISLLLFNSYRNNWTNISQSVIISLILIVFSIFFIIQVKKKTRNRLMILSKKGVNLNSTFFPWSHSYVFLASRDYTREQHKNYSTLIFVSHSGKRLIEIRNNDFKLNIQKLMTLIEFYRRKE
ncbi:hypothetical protein [Salibacter halophilus]|uniref:Uncharacterized protein n=1 Tax=Salibacter halophilus TaxID=1803916 RepID=A0A6N6M5J9_9FLAO|nr:hypothetical protein [Salibacter halophilus]KAB1064803.1 hypothetical protein F3059_05455 [Salibacter halophilus]